VLWCTGGCSESGTGTAQQEGGMWGGGGILGMKCVSLCVLCASKGLSYKDM